MKEEFDPNKWTEKELIKHLYREVKRLSSEIAGQGIIDSEIIKRLSAIEKDIVRLDVSIETTDKESQKRINRFALIIAIIGVIISAIAFWFG